LKTAINRYGAIGLGLASVSAVTQDWSLPEFCWSTWLAGLAYTWACILTAAFQIMLKAWSDRAVYVRYLPFLRQLSPTTFILVVTVASIGAVLLAFRVSIFVFGFYGLFLSVYAEMEPLAYFGKNGFINSDFFTPLIHLLNRFWPMAAGVLISNWQDFLLQHPWKRIVVPIQREILRLHLMILSLPFLSLLAWALFMDSYQPVTILLLMALFYLLPKKFRGDASGATGDVALFRKEDIR
jgi:hypothetical protein